MIHYSSKAILGLLILFLAPFPVFASGEGEAEQPEEFVLGFMSSFTGSFAAVAETQHRGAKLAVEEINADGGLEMPWGRVPVRVVVSDDEARLSVGVQRFRELVDEGVHALVGTVWNPMTEAINEETKITPVPFIATSVPDLGLFEEGSPGPGFYSVAMSPWSIGYLSGRSAIEELGAETIYFVSRSDPWGASIYQGLEAAIQELGGRVVGFAEFPRGTTDYSRALIEAAEIEPDVFMACQFGGDAIELFRQALAMGMTEVATMFNTWTTGTAAQEQVHGLSYFYHDLAALQDPMLIDRSREYTRRHVETYGEPPDAYGTIAYVATTIMLQAAEAAGSFEVSAVSEALASRTFETVRGDVSFREDHQMAGDHLAFLVKGKDRATAEDEWDVFEVLGSFGAAETLPSQE
jgi:ABC-type branched-subunit amino acid transport system substrate-binding protein